MTKDDKKDMPETIYAEPDGYWHSPDVRPLKSTKYTRADAGQAVRVTVDEILEKLAKHFKVDLINYCQTRKTELSLISGWYPSGLIIKPDQKGSNNDE